MKEKLLNLAIEFWGVLALTISIAPFYAAFRDFKADETVWAIVDVLLFPIGFIRGLLLFFNVI